MMLFSQSRLVLDKIRERIPFLTNTDLVRYCDWRQAVWDALAW